MKLSEMMQWLLQLLPQQKAKGQGNVQVGSVGGDFSNTQNNSNQAVYIFINQEAAVNAPSSPGPIQSSAVDPSTPTQATAAPSLSDDQAYILKVMRYEPELGALAERFMRKQFQTSYVKGLSSHQARRVVLYIYKCAENKNAARQNVNA